MTVSRVMIRRIPILLVMIYGLLMCLMMLLRLTGDGESGLVARINVSITLLLMPSLLLFPLCLVLRRGWAAATLVLPFFAFIITYIPLFLPRTINIPVDAPRLRLMTYNLHAEKTILAPMEAIIRDSAADIIAVQEMSPTASATFEIRLADVYPYRALYPSPDGSPYHGRGLLSRYPITESQTWLVEYPIPVRLMRAVIEVNGTKVTIYNFHAPPSYPIYGQGFDIHLRGDQIDQVLAMIAGETGAVVFMGDFNTNDTDVNYPHIITQVQDTYREIGWGMGFTGPDWSHPQSQEGLPFIPIHQRMDYIFHNRFFLPVEARVWPISGGSDHRPVYAMLALTNLNKQ